MRILIVKLGALGDVLRTTPLLRGLKKRYPKSRITWVVEKRHAAVLEGNPLIERLWTLSSGLNGRLCAESFDAAINLDKDEAALHAIHAARAEKKMGFGLSDEGRLCPLDDASQYAYRLGIDDDLKFRTNRKTYQEISFEQAGLRFRGEEYLFHLDPASVSFAKGFFKKRGLDRRARKRPMIGVNTGSGDRFAGKRLPIETSLDLVRRLHARLGAAVLLLGGPDEVERNRWIERKSSSPVINTGSHPIRRFAALVQQCDTVISGDTTAMHIAIAVRVPVVAYFGSTCAAEIELYGRGTKIAAETLCAPCYKKACPIEEQCMEEIRADILCRAVKQTLRRSG